MGLSCLLELFAGLEARVPPTRWEEKLHGSAKSGVRKRLKLVIHYHIF